MTIKKTLFLQLQQFIDQRIANAQKAMKAAQASKSNETKSTAGDKFETGRAMMQAEEERSKVQLAKAYALQSDLAQVNIGRTNATVVLGSLVLTNQGNYFISIGIGKIIIADTLYYAISLASPIGQLLFGKETGAIVFFREKQIVIKSIL